MRKIIIGLAPTLLVMSSGAYAQTPGWKVSEVSGDVRLVENGRTRAAVRGALLSSGSTIATGANAKAVIVRGEEFVVISPRSQLRVPAAEAPNKIMQMIEDFGTAVFKIRKKSTPHFGVQTPYLAAVVKGTTFTVTVGPKGGSVQVTEGAVEVSTLDGGAKDLVRPGGIAQVGASDLYRLTVQGESNKVIRSEKGNAAGAAKPQTLAYAGPSARAVEVRARVGEGPKSLSDATGGLVEGHSGVESAHANVKDLEHGRGNGNGNAGGNGNGNGNGSENGGSNGSGDEGKDNGGGSDGTPPTDTGNGNGPPADPGDGNGTQPAEPEHGGGAQPADPGHGNGTPPADPGNGGTPPADPGQGGGTPPADPGHVDNGGSGDDSGKGDKDDGDSDKDDKDDGGSGDDDSDKGDKDGGSGDDDDSDKGDGGSGDEDDDSGKGDDDGSSGDEEDDSGKGDDDGSSGDEEDDSGKGDDDGSSGDEEDDSAKGDDDSGSGDDNSGSGSDGDEDSGSGSDGDDDSGSGSGGGGSGSGGSGSGDGSGSGSSGGLLGGVVDAVEGAAGSLLSPR